MKVNRRDLFNLLGVAGASTLLGRGGVARADAGMIPRRLVFYYTGGTLKQCVANGTSPATLKPFWAPDAPGAPNPHSIATPWSTSNFTMRDIHQPLVPFQKKLLFLDGIDMRSSALDPLQADNAHIAGATHAMTGIGRKTPGLAGGISIDQFIARAINNPAPVTAVPSLELGISSDSYPYENEQQQSTNAPLYAGAGQPIGLSTNPLNAYKRLLPNGPSNAAAEAQAKLALRIKRRKSVLDYARREFGKQSSQLGKLDRDRLDAHASSIRDLESRLSVPPNSACSQPTSASIVAAVAGKNGPASFKAHTDVMFQLTQVALACDLTRVVTVVGGAIPYEQFGYVAGMSGSSDFHDLCHKTNGFDAPLANDAAAIATVKACHTAESVLFAQFLGLLDAVPEADGSSLLDNTLVVWCGQIAGHDHSLDHIPYVLAGGMRGGVTPGRYVRYPRTVNTTDWPMYSNGPAHNDLFVKLANLMGVQTGTFGNPGVCKGPLAGLA